MKGGKQRNQGAGKDRKRNGWGLRGVAGSDKASRKKACGRGEISKGVKSRGRHGNGRRAV